MAKAAINDFSYQIDKICSFFSIIIILDTSINMLNYVKKIKDYVGCLYSVLLWRAIRKSPPAQYTKNNLIKNGLWA